MAQEEVRSSSEAPCQSESTEPGIGKGRVATLGEHPFWARTNAI
jgi:hypothetical protein